MTVHALKEQISSMTGMPANKQKMSLSSGLILKNSATLAFYNVRSGDVVSVGAKERGGRK
jgi:splicing factor 3A subunit 1